MKLRHQFTFIFFSVIWVENEFYEIEHLRKFSNYETVQKKSKVKRTTQNEHWKLPIPMNVEMLCLTHIHKNTHCACYRNISQAESFSSYQYWRNTHTHAHIPYICVQMYFESTSLCQIIQAFSTSMFPLDWWTLERRWNAHNSCEFSFHFRNMLCVYWWIQVEMWCSCNGLASPTPASTVGFLRILQLGATRGKE